MKIPLRENKSLKLKNYQLNLLMRILDVFLHGTECRNRNKFVKRLLAQAQTADQERINILKGLAVKDEKGEPIIKDGNFDLGENRAEFEKQYRELMNEEFIVDNLESTKEELATIKKLVLESKIDLNYADGEVYGQICEELGED